MCQSWQVDEFLHHRLLWLYVPLQEAKKLFEEKFKSGKNRWFFTKLRF